MQSNQPNLDPTIANAASLDAPVVPIVNTNDQQIDQPTAQAQVTPTQTAPTSQSNSKVANRNCVEIWNMPF